jgi:DNA-binding PadR family transcriptional regulator
MEYVILGMALRAPVHGYELLRDWQEKYHLNQVWRFKPGALYAALEKLERMGFLTPTIVPNPTSPPRKEYQITQLGVEAFNEWVRKPVTSPKFIRHEFMAKLYFAREIGNDCVSELVHEQHKLSQEWLESFQTEGMSEAEFETWMCQYRITQAQSFLSWLEQVQLFNLKRRSK